MSASHFILLVEDERTGSEALAKNLVRLGIEPIRVDDLAQATELVKSKEYTIEGILLPTYLPGSEMKNGDDPGNLTFGTITTRAYCDSRSIDSSARKSTTLFATRNARRRIRPSGC